ncbi:hypothetical protein BB559_007201 [Furculomyces boomerangus]|uniref:HTH cro/C1-type domain-containing protein n=1 Tax=Furculomyces boomerangus TaxID=61424 RepID=A0A2T9XYI2_9FUNG|nr:hypothetical protein BB559_007201 [Furculomyces boomerangus]
MNPEDITYPQTTAQTAEVPDLRQQVDQMQVQINILTKQIEDHQDELYLLYSELLSDLVILAWRTLEKDYNPKRGEGWAAYLQRLSTDTNALRIRELKPSDIEFLARREKEIWHRDKREFVVTKEIGRDEVWVASLFFGKASPSKTDIEKLSAVLNLSQDTLLTEFITNGFPNRGSTEKVEIPSDPLLYRLHEALVVYGPGIRSIILEKFGDGVMSAIDFTASVKKVKNPNGDRVSLTMEGKFLPYKKW